MSNERWEPVAGHMHYDKFTVAYDGAYIEVPDIAVTLPADLRLCRRVEQPDEPITAEALRREEWVCLPEDEGVYERWLSSDEDETFVMVIIRGKEQLVQIVYGEMEYEYVDAPGCRTMPQLRALVEMLGGGE